MRKAEVIARVTKIRNLRNDPEQAHAEEDKLFADVLEAIANGKAEEPRGLARTALGTQKIKFPRRCS